MYLVIIVYLRKWQDIIALHGVLNQGQEEGMEVGGGAARAVLHRNCDH